MTTVRDDLLRLLDTGDVETPTARGKYLPTRGYRLSRQGAARIGASSMRVVGEVAAGEPAIAFDPYPTSSRTLKDVFGLSPEDYLVPVRGWSMEDLGVRPRDLLIIHPQPPDQLHEGEVVVAVVHESPDMVGLTLKRWYREPGGRVRLHPAHLDLDRTRTPGGTSRSTTTVARSRFSASCSGSFARPTPRAPDWPASRWGLSRSLAAARLPASAPIWH
jgi:SOS-response transcriptional repressor LexA